MDSYESESEADDAVSVYPEIGKVRPEAARDPLLQPPILGAARHGLSEV